MVSGAAGIDVHISKKILHRMPIARVSTPVQRVHVVPLFELRNTFWKSALSGCQALVVPFLQLFLPVCFQRVFECLYWY
jgi:hypothetical protein